MTVCEEKIDCLGNTLPDYDDLSLEALDEALESPRKPAHQAGKQMYLKGMKARTKANMMQSDKTRKKFNLIADYYFEAAKTLKKGQPLTDIDPQDN